MPKTKINIYEIFFIIKNVQQVINTLAFQKMFLISKKTVLLSLLLTTATIGFSQGLFSSKLTKSFAALEIHDYFKAKKYFEKSLKKNPVPASYGLSVIYYRNNNPFHNIDSALYYIQEATFYYPKLSPKKKKNC